jgi:hypothetical protein
VNGARGRVFQFVQVSVGRRQISFHFGKVFFRGITKVRSLGLQEVLGRQFLIAFELADPCFQGGSLHSNLLIVGRELFLDERFDFRTEGFAVTQAVDHLF